VVTPWKKMLTSGPLWAIVVAHVSYTWVTSWMMSYLPKYLRDRLKFDVQEVPFIIIIIIIVVVVLVVVVVVCFVTFYTSLYTYYFLFHIQTFFYAVMKLFITLYGDVNKSSTRAISVFLIILSVCNNSISLLIFVGRSVLFTALRWADVERVLGSLLERQTPTTGSVHYRWMPKAFSAHR
jgi:hypothetical protein